MSGWNIIYGLINFLILAGGLYLVGRKIVAKLFKGHQKEVADALEGADAAELKAGELQRELPLRRAKDDEAIEAFDGSDMSETRRLVNSRYFKAKRQRLIWSLLPGAHEKRMAHASTRSGDELHPAQVIEVMIGF